MKLPRLLTVAGLALAFIALNESIAHEGHDHGSPTSVPETAEAIMQEIQKHHGQITTAVTAKNLKDVHQHAEALTALAKALPDKVSEEKKARVQGSANNMAKLVDTLHHAADDGDQPRAGIELKKLDGVIMALEKQLR